MLTHRGGAPEIRKKIAARGKRARTPWASATETSDPLSLMPQADGPGGLSTSDFAQVFQPPRANIGPPNRCAGVLGLHYGRFGACSVSILATFRQHLRSSLGAF